MQTAFVCLYTVPAKAEPSIKRGVALYFDQDLFTLGLNQDRDYTTGIAVEFFSQHDGIYPLDRMLRWVGGELGLHAEDAVFERSFILGSVTYTPDDLSASVPIYDDRPYASLVYLGNKRVFADDDSALGIDMQVGILGSGISREVQQALHETWRELSGNNEPVDPKGWDHQISDGGEPTVGLRVSYAEKLSPPGKPWDLAGTASISLGYQTNASVGLSARAGRISSKVWTLPYDPINRGNFLPSLSGDEWYLWAAYRARLVVYDALLQGQFRDSDVTFNNSELHHVVHDAGVGLTLTYRPVQVTFAINGKSSELKVGDADRNHVWGGVYVSTRY